MRAGIAGSHIVSACTGTFVLAEAGLLDDRDATTHWAFVDLLRSEYPRTRIHADRVLVSATGDGRIVTSGGAASWMDLVLYVVGKFAGPEEAMRLAKIQMYDWHHNGQNPYSRLTTRPQTSDKQIHVCQEWLADHYRDTDPVVEMIRQSGLSRRPLVAVSRPLRSCSAGVCAEGPHRRGKAVAGNRVPLCRTDRRGSGLQRCGIFPAPVQANGRRNPGSLSAAAIGFRGGPCHRACGPAFGQAGTARRSQLDTGEGYFIHRVIELRE